MDQRARCPRRTSRTGRGGRHDGAVAGGARDRGVPAAVPGAERRAAPRGGPPPPHTPTQPTSGGPPPTPTPAPPTRTRPAPPPPYPPRPPDAAPRRPPGPGAG